eukprot:403019-Alexandrium_andersonii.AAC.1
MPPGMQWSRIVARIALLPLSPLRETRLRPILARFGVDVDDVWPVAEYWERLAIRTPEGAGCVP